MILAPTNNIKMNSLLQVKHTMELKVINQLSYPKQN
jgi:hypothetical protein